MIKHMYTLAIIILMFIGILFRANFCYVTDQL